ncbi:hypothetical protein BAUCODRAFT_245238 [Baudoinia panamericana UAMH 10762]|uniref:Uncharacterized protein n=1 Tax=Baudoinia panamericana (strain UAMH 10762) TaxID=717646 RepID=M2MAR5_BAUPA|nr:uncharacterized protein BAUCODRAFT_245238 [Baudoinia panamericana UAMH 10762]EMC93546.1 hypothetical protein BAUCODRAFT_245238 [Baudoinia panamericana UAMH 10762]
MQFTSKRPAAEPQYEARVSIDLLADPDFPLHQQRTPTRSSSRIIRPRSQQSMRRSLSVSRPDMITPDEFARLPVSVQKKYFSEQERLRIAQEGAAQMRRKHSRKPRWLSIGTSVDLKRPQSAHELRKFSSSSDRCGTPDLFHQHIITFEQALWFLDLSDRARRQQFSKAEAALLNAESEAILQANNAGATHPALQHRQAVKFEDTINVAGAAEETRPSAGEAPDKGSGALQAPADNLLSPALHRAATAARARRRSPSPRPPEEAYVAARKPPRRALALTPIKLPPPTLMPLPSQSPVSPKTIDFPDDSVDDDADTIDSESPSTPASSTDMAVRTVIQSASFDSGIGLPLQLNVPDKDDSRLECQASKLERAPGSRAAGRPGFLTPSGSLHDLPRPETRDCGIDDTDPLALAPLRVIDDPTGAQGAFALRTQQEPKSRRTLWKGMSLRRR